MTQPVVSEDSETAHSETEAGGLARSRSGSEGVSTYLVPTSFRNPVDVLKRASIHASRDKSSEALHIYEEGLKIYPKEADLWSGKGVCLRSMGRLDEALQCYQEALRLDPKNANAINNIGVIHKERGDLNKAVRHPPCDRHIEVFHFVFDSFWISVYKTDANKLPEDGTTLVVDIIFLCTPRKTRYTRAVWRERTRNVPEKNPFEVTLNLSHTWKNYYQRLTLRKLYGATSPVTSTAALESYKEALNADPTYSPCYYNLGVLYAEKNDTENALRMYREAIRINPAYVEAHNNTGAVYKSLGKLEKAIEHYELALVHNPEYKITQINMAVALTDLGTKRKEADGPKDGVRLYKRALAYNAYYADAYYNLGVAYAELTKYERALTHYKLAVNFNPQCAEAFNNMGVIQKDRECIDDAIKCYNKALEIKPDFAQTLNNLGVIYTFIGKMTEALKYAKKALEVSPNYAEAYNNLGVLYRDRGEIELSIEAYDKCLALDPNSPNAFHNKLLALNYQHSLPTDQVYRLSKTWSEQFLRHRSPYKKWKCELVRIRPIRGDTPESSLGTGTRRTRSSRRIRLGYIGPDFFTHSVSYFIHTPLLYHDRDQFHVTVYANVVRDDAKTQLLMKLADRWRSIVGMAETEVGRIIHDEDKIDILVELAGHTANNRLDVLAYKPAPIQMNWIGYPNTTGLSTIDYRITDPVADPLQTKQKYVEKLLRLPRCFLCYQPPPSLPADFEVKPPPAIDSGFVTFGSFNNLAKMSDQVLSLWSRILLAVPNSRLLLKARPFASKEMQRWFVEKFEARGVSAHRVDTMSLVPACADHLMVYNLIDIALDTFPYAGTTTTCEALLMGVPVISMRGHNNHAHNVGVSLLLYYGLSELVAENPENYFSRAVEGVGHLFQPSKSTSVHDHNIAGASTLRLPLYVQLSNDVKRLVDYRRRIHQSVLRMARKENAEIFTRELEELYRGAAGKIQLGASTCGAK